MNCLRLIVSSIYVSACYVRRRLLLFLIFFFISQFVFSQTTIGLTIPTNPTTVCQGTAIGISGTSNDPNALFVKWVRVTNGLTTATGPVLPTTPDGFGNFTYSFNFNAAVVSSLQTTHVFRMVFGPTENDVDFETIPPAFETSNTLTITVNPNPTATLTALGGITTACFNGSSPTVNVTGVIGTAPFTYTYRITDPLGVVGSNQTIVSNGAGLAQLTVPTSGTTGNYTYQLLQIQDASSTTCSTVSTATLTMTIQALPTATINASSLTACVNTTAPTVTITGAGGTAPFTFTYREITNSTPGSNQTIVSNLAGVATFSSTINSAATRSYELVSVQESSATACINAQTSSVTIVTNANPDATGATPILPEICQGVTAFNVTFLGISGGPDQYRIVWDATALAAGFTNLGFQAYNTGTNTINVPAPAAATPSTYNGTLRLLNSSTGCFLENSNAVTINPLPTAAIISSVPTVCLNGTAPTVTITATGATAPYTITYRVITDGVPGINQTVVTNIGGVATLTVPVTTAAVLNYELVSVQDNSATACVNAQTASTTITINALPAAIITPSGATTFCAGGSVTLNANTGPSLTYLWSDASTASSIASIGSTGTYSVTVTNTSTGCFSTSTATTVTVNALPAATITPSGATTFCAGGSVTLNANTGPSLTYLWSDASTASSITSIGSTGTYSVTVTNTSTGCFATSTATTVTVNALPAAIITPSGPTTFCAGGSVTLNANTGPTLTHLWSDASTASSITSIATTGTYSVTVTNTSTGCFATSTATTVTVNALPTPTINASGPLTFCVGNSVNLTASGGTSYAWSNGTNVALTNITTSGTYTVTVTDVNSCVNQTSTTVIVNALPTPTINASGPLTFCVGNSVNLTASGGTSYAWSNGTNVALTNITTAGTYTVTVTDVNSCVNQTSTTVIVNALPTPTINASGPLTFCAGNSVNLTASGGTSYAWSNGTNVALTNITTTGTYTVTVTDVNSCVNQTSTTVIVNALPTPTINASGPLTFCAGNSVNLTASGGTSYAWSNGTNVALTNITTAGTYTVTVTDVNSCVNQTSTTVIVNALPTPTINASGPLTFCVGNSVNLTASGGTSYAWSNGTNVALTNITTAGTYTVTVTDINNCVNLTSTIVTVNPLPIVNPITGLNTVCIGSTINLSSTTSGGVWSVNNANAAISGLGVLTGQAAGTTTVSYTVTDINNCTAAITANKTIHALPAVAPILGAPTLCVGSTTTLTNATPSGQWLVNNANASINSSGVLTGQSPGATTVFYIVTDGNNCSTTVSAGRIINALPTVTITPSGLTTFCTGGSVNLTSSVGASYLWSNGSTAAAISNITSSGTYTVTVTDINSCSATSAPTTITVNALPTATITPSGSTTFCAGGSVNLTSSVGASYLWSNGSTAAAISNITSSGTYTVTVTDINSCSATSAPTTITVNTLPTATITPSGSTTFCAGGSVNLTSSAGASYLWSNGSTGPTISNVTSSGTYTVTVTNINTCSATSAPITITVNPLPTATITASGPTTVCAGNAVILNAPGGTGYNYTWTGGGNTSTRVYTAPGNYAVQITDANGCTSTSSAIAITVNPIPTLTITNPIATCSPATVNLTAADITAGSTSGVNLTYWSNVANTIPLTTPSAIGTSGTYYIRATHPTTGCFTTRAVAVNIQAQASIQINTPAAICAPATVNLTAPTITNGSETGLTYSYFTDAAASNTLVNPNAVNTSGTYYIKGVPASGCSAIVPVVVTINPSPTLVVNQPAAICAPASIDLTATAITNGSETGLSFTYFTNAALTTQLNNASTVNTSGTYYIRAANATGCTTVRPVTVLVNPLPQGELQTPAIPYICENGSRTLTATGASSYQWLFNQQPINGATTATFEARAAGNYAVRFISPEGCSAVSSNSIRLDLVTEPNVKFTLTNVCAGVTTSFNNTSITSTSGGINWLWDFGDGTSSNQFSTTHIYTNAGDYVVKLTATSPVCSSFIKEASATYRVEQATPATRYADIEVLNNIPITITARAIGTNYVWRPTTGINSSNIAAPTFRVNTTTEYTVAITNAIGCTTTDTVLVKVIQGEDILVPQGFTPNADGRNDRLFPILVGMRQLNYFRVFNRWGNMIFTTKDASEQSGWNGAYLGVTQPTGAYTWVAEAVDLQGRVVRRSGTVLLLK